MNEPFTVRTRVDGFRYGTGTLESQQCDLRRFDDGSGVSEPECTECTRRARVSSSRAREVRDAVELET